MRLKIYWIFLSVMIIGAFSLASSAVTPLTPEDPTSETYLLNHGHSQEIVRMINLQKARTEGNISTPLKSEGKCKKFFKNLWYAQDLTLPTSDFGYNDIKAVETGEDLDQKAINLVHKVKKTSFKSADLEHKKNKDVKSDEININHVQVREAK